MTGSVKGYCHTGNTNKKQWKARTAGEALSRPGCCIRAGKKRDALEMILHIEADAEELDVVSLESARYRLTIWPLFPQIRRVTP